MSLINKMLQDLEKRRPQGAVGDVLPAQVIAVAPHRSLHATQWISLLIMILLGIGVSTWLLLLRPSASAAINVISATLNPPAPAQPLPTDAVQSDQTQPSLLLVTPTFHDLTLEAGMGSSSGAAIPHATPDQTRLVATTFSQVASQPDPSLVTSVPTPVTVLPVNQPPLQIDAIEKKQQRTTQVSDSHLPTNLILDKPQKTTDAIISNKQIKEITPSQQAENEYRKALESLQQGHMTRALESLAHALQLDASHIAARQAIVGLLVEAQRFDEAEHQLQAGLHLDPNQPGLVMMLARLQVERGDTHAGLGTLQRGLPDAMARADYVTEQADYQAFLAALLQREGQHGAAIKHYMQALNKTPQSGIWLMGIGISLQAENRLPEAQEAFNRAKASNTLRPDLQMFVEQRLKQIKQQS